MESSRSDMQLCLRLSALSGLVSACALCSFVGADVSSLDAGELGGAAESLGVPHPSGFPLDMLLLKAASLWPLGTLAFRQNLCTSLVAAAAVSCIVFAGTRLAQRCGWSSASAGVAAASVSTAALLSSRTFLDAALSVEVYASALLCVALAGVLASAVDMRLRRAIWPLTGLALGAHVTAPLLIGPLAIAALSRSRRWTTPLIALIAGALLLCYVPLASLRDTAFDWGDPETLDRWLRHVSAARIREAYQSSLFTPDGLPRVRLVEQLVEQPYWLPLALMGVIGVARQQRPTALVLGLVLCLDLAYASWINPMGVAQRQVGHASLAVIALFAGCGCALLVELLPLPLRAAGRLGVAMISCACLWSVGRVLWQTSANDGYAVSERYGAASPLSDLPPRALYVCESDSACASALFAIYAEGVRPDLDVVPAQHLWDPTVMRRLRGLPLAAAADVGAWPPPAERAGWAARRLRELVQQERRPVYMERVEHLAAVGFNLAHAPFIAVSTAGATEQDVLGPIERARFGALGPTSPLQRELWASAHETLGTLWLRSGRDRSAVAEFSRVVALTPLRAAARSNLGVALERRGDLKGALRETVQAVELDPQRATPWVNLTRLLLRTQGQEAARLALANARRYEVTDKRLDALARELDNAQGTTRK